MPVSRTPPTTSRSVTSLAFVLCFGSGCGKLDTSPTQPSTSESAVATASGSASAAPVSADAAIVEQLRADNAEKAPNLKAEILRSENGRIVELRLSAPKEAITNLTKVGALDALRRLLVHAREIDAETAPAGPLANLEFLGLLGQLRALPEWVTSLPKLKNLQLSLNALDQLPPSFAKLQTLEGLNISNNAFTTIPESVLGLRNLETLQLTDSRLTSLPDGLRQLQRLRMLNVSANQLTEFPPAVFELSALDTLRASNNQLKRLPPAIGKLTHLTSLKLHDNQLTALPNELRGLKLQYLTVERNLLVNPDERLKRIFGREPPPTWATEPQNTKPR